MCNIGRKNFKHRVDLIFAKTKKHIRAFLCLRNSSQCEIKFICCSIFNRARFMMLIEAD